MIKCCPSCKARFKGQATCHRCGADLSLLLSLERQLQASVKQAALSYRRGDYSTLDNCVDTIRKLDSSNPAIKTFAKFLAEKLTGPIIKPLGKTNDSGNRKLLDGIMDSAREVYGEIGAGLKLAAYENCLSREFSLRKINFKRNYPVTLNYKGLKLNSGACFNHLVESGVAVVLSPSRDEFRILQERSENWLRLTGLTQGFLIDFDAV